jgi:hypothetical protein
MQGPFLVTAADEGSAVLRDVESGQVYTLSENPGLDAREVVAATLEADPTGLTHTAAVESRWTVPVEVVDERPADAAAEAAAGRDPGEMVAIDRAGATLHVLSVPADRTDGAAREVADDEATVERAARLGADGVTIRAAEGVVSVRYLGT